MLPPIFVELQSPFVRQPLFTEAARTGVSMIDDDRCAESPPLMPDDYADDCANAKGPDFNLKKRLAWRGSGPTRR